MVMRMALDPVTINVSRTRDTWKIRYERSQSNVLHEIKIIQR